MLENIQNTNSEIITQNQGLEKISGLGVSSYKQNDSNFFIDESDISSLAIEKYEREEDVKKFSEILMNTSEKEANDLVISKALDGSISIDDEDILSSLLESDNFIDDVIK